MMSKPPAGYYRKLMPSHLSHVRLAIANQHMSGVTEIDNSSTLNVLDASDDEHAKYYADGLRDGRFVAVRETAPERIWRTGELFFGS